MGAYIDLSQQEVVWLQVGEGLVHAARRGTNPGRMGNAEPGCAVSGCFATSDGRFVAIVTRTRDEAKRLATLTDEVMSWVAARTLDAALADLRAHGIGAAAVNTYLTAMHEPAMAPWLERVVHPVTGEQTYLRVPVRVDGEPVSTRRPAPCFNEHTREVLAELAACSPGDLDRLERDGIIGGSPGAPAHAS
jgi:crotonobetainyl-CoA:carnitine CoA-transferase CaiB-like acyl-CoA transferase